MEPVSYWIPKCDALATMTTSTHIKAYLTELSRRISNRSSIEPTITDIEVEYHQDTTETKEDGNVSVAPSPTPLAAPILLTSFSAESVQGKVDLSHILSIYVTL